MCTNVLDTQIILLQVITFTRLYVYYIEINIILLCIPTGILTYLYILISGPGAKSSKYGQRVR